MALTEARTPSVCCSSWGSGCGPTYAPCPFHRLAAETYGRLRAGLERAGTPLSEPDLRSAAIALSRDRAAVTSNVRHFARVPGLQVENWLIAALVGAGLAAVGGYGALRPRPRN